MQHWYYTLRSALFTHTARITARLLPCPQSCAATSERSPSPAAVRAALGLPPDSPPPVTTARLAAVELRLQQSVDTELAAVRALLSPGESGESREKEEGEEGGLAALTARLVTLETALTAAERQQNHRVTAERVADNRLDSMTAEMEALRQDMAGLHLSLAAAQRSLKQAGSCCNRTGPDWGSLLGEEIGRLESQLEDRMQLYSATIRKGGSA